jgi:hypothetical protein
MQLLVTMLHCICNKDSISIAAILSPHQRQQTQHPHDKMIISYRDSS